jgi:hypothetical protein
MKAAELRCCLAIKNENNACYDLDYSAGEESDFSWKRIHKSCDKEDQPNFRTHQCPKEDAASLNLTKSPAQSLDVAGSGFSLRIASFVN